MSPLEARPAGPDEAPLRYPPIFVVGPPRSGTTLVYQAVIEYFDVGYLSNFHGWFWGAPSWVERIVRPRRWRPVGDYRSELGNTFGWGAASECAVFWHRFLPPRPDVLAAARVEPERLARLRRGVRRFIDACDRAVVFKTVQSNGRLGLLTTALPEALFLVVDRDPLDTARSLLAARRRVSGSYDTWWSFEPPGVEELRRLPASEQVLEQVLRTQALIDDGLAALPARRVHRVEYEAFCDDPRRWLAAIGDFLEPSGVAPRSPAEVPPRFARRADHGVPQALDRRLVEAYERRTKLAGPARSSAGPRPAG